MAHKKGTPKTKGSGRKKGTPNKVTGDVRAMIAEALDKAGGVEYLVAQALKENPAAFLSLVRTITPTTIQGLDEDGSIIVNVNLKK